MIVPLDTAAAQPPPPAGAARDHQRRRQPEALDPELEARLRRQRAQQYGHSVRENLAAWHQRFSSRRQEQLTAQRAEWEAQRAARLARLADKHQQTQAARPTAAARQAAASTDQPGEEGATRGDLLQALTQLDAKLSRPAGLSPQRIPAGVHQQLAGQRPLHPAAVSRTPCVGGACSISKLNMPAAAGAQPAAVASADAAGSNEPPPQADPLVELLAALLAAEGGGDPCSIINLFVEEQLQAAVAFEGAVPAAARRQRAGRVAAGVAAQQAGKQPASGNGTCPVSAHAEAWQPLGHGTEQDSAAAAAAAGERPVSAASDRENVPANVAQLRHRRAGSMLLQNFDASAGQQIGSAGIAAAGAMPHQPPVQQNAAPAAHDNEQEALLLQQESSKQLYVQQWLQRSTAELAAGAELAPASSSAAAYSADLDHVAAAELEALPSSPSSVAHTVQPWPQAAAPAAGAASQDAAASSKAARALAVEPEAQSEAAAVVPNAMQCLACSIAASAASAASSGRRPRVPEPPSSPSLPDSSTPLSGGLELALPGPQRDAAAEAAETVCSMPAAAVEAEEEVWSESVSSNSSKGELPAALSFGQLEAVAAAGAAADLRQASTDVPAAAGAADEELKLSAPSSSSRGASSSRLCSSSSSAASPAAQQAAYAAMPAPPAAGAVAQAVQQQGQQQGSGLRPINQQQEQQGQQGSEAYSSDFDSDVEVSYGEQYGSSSPSSPRPGAATATGLAPRQQQLVTAGLLEAGAVQPGAAAAALASLQSPRQQPALPPQMQRPRRPLHATDDRYPGSPPASPGMQPPAAASRPLSPASLAGSRRASGEGGAGSSSSSPGSPAAVHLQQPAGAITADAEPEAVQQEDTMVVCSPSGSGAGEGPGEGLVLRAADSPYAMLQFGTEPEEEAGSAAASTIAAAAATELAGGSSGSPVGAAAADTEGAAGSPPATPVLVPLGGEHGSCPGSARVEDGTVVQTEEHVREYLGEVLSYFWAERAEAFAAGEVPPLELDGYLGIERRRQACGDPQHIFNKLLFDATNEALLAHYNQALDSYTGRLAPRLALLGPEQLERNVAQRVLRWAGLGAGAGAGGAGGDGGADLSAMLAEDAAEDERALRQLTGAMQAELAAAASGSRPDTPNGGMTSGEQPSA